MPPSVTRIVSDIILAYDHNRNGVIDLQRQQAGGNVLQRLGNRLRNPDERVRSNTSVYSVEDEVTISTHVRTRHHLFVAADANQDKQVTREELTAVVKQYDRNNNGKLDGAGIFFWRDSEKRDFRKDFGERTEAYGSISF